MDEAAAVAAVAGGDVRLRLFRGRFARAYAMKWPRTVGRGTRGPWPAEAVAKASVVGGAGTAVSSAGQSEVHQNKSRPVVAHAADYRRRRAAQPVPCGLLRRGGGRARRPRPRPRLSGGREKAEEDPARSLESRRRRGPGGGPGDSGDADDGQRVQASRIAAFVRSGNGALRRNSRGRITAPHSSSAAEAAAPSSAGGSPRALGCWLLPAACPPPHRLRRTRRPAQVRPRQRTSRPVRGLYCGGDPAALPRL